MNLALDRWIPVVCRDGSTSIIAPWEITLSHGDNPAVALHSFRPDFDGALIQFLVGLLQTACPPEDEDDWADFWDEAPSPEILRTAFEAVSDAFEFRGDGARFMQDLDPLEGEKEMLIGELLIGYPGSGNTIEFNRDHFIKRDTVNGICLSCCAISLITLQTLAPSGGKGHRASVRRASPVTALLKSIESDRQTLWSIAWLNVMDEEAFSEIPGDHSKKGKADIFPWMGPTVTSEGGREHLPSDGNPLQAYWGMPRRIRVNFSHTEEGACDLCGKESEKLIKTFRRKNLGFKYTGWEHPLSPHEVNSNKVKQAVNFTDNEITYRYWPTFVLPPLSRKKQEHYLPPKVVSHFFQQRLQETEATLHVFGYSMQSMKITRWNEAHMPIFRVSQEIQEDYRKVALNMAIVAENIARDLQFCGEKARKFLGREKYPLLNQGFLRKSEALFYGTLKKLGNDFGSKDDLLHIWHKDMKRHCLDLFDKHVTDAFVRKGEMKNVLNHRMTLKEKVSNKVNRQLLGLS